MTIYSADTGLTGWRNKLTYHTYKVLGGGNNKMSIVDSVAELRISELFEIIVDFPDSAPAVEDLKEW